MSTSVWGSWTKGNAFVDDDDPYGLSKTARHFIAGLLAHVRGMTGVLTPLVNSYRRLVPGFEAPVYISWARTTARRWSVCRPFEAGTPPPPASNCAVPILPAIPTWPSR